MTQTKAILNFRKLKQDFSAQTLREGANLFAKEMIKECYLTKVTNKSLHLAGIVGGAFGKKYRVQAEIDRISSEIVDNSCECSEEFDCPHVACLLLHLEKFHDDLLARFASDNQIQADSHQVDAKLVETIKEAQKRAETRAVREFEKELMTEYRRAAQVLSLSPIFACRHAEVFQEADPLIFLQYRPDNQRFYCALSLRVKSRSKPLAITDCARFLEAYKFQEPYPLNAQWVRFTADSFSKNGAQLLELVAQRCNYAFAYAERRSQPELTERFLRYVPIENDVVAQMLRLVYDQAQSENRGKKESELPFIFWESLEKPMKACFGFARIRLDFESLKMDPPKIVVNASVAAPFSSIPLERKEMLVLGGIQPGLIFEHYYAPFDPQIRQAHLRKLHEIDHLIIPQPLIGTFKENALLMAGKVADMPDLSPLEQFVTRPFEGMLKAQCKLFYVDTKLEAQLGFDYNGVIVDASPTKISPKSILSFVKKDCVYARNLDEEQRLLQSLFQDFSYDPEQGLFIAKSDRRVIEFMTETVPNMRDRVTFHCPDNLLRKFCYDTTSFSFHFCPCKKTGFYQCKMVVDGPLEGIAIERLWECLMQERAYLSLGKQGKEEGQILVLQLNALAPLVQFFDEMGIRKIANYTTELPLWTLIHLDKKALQKLPVEVTVAQEIQELRKQMLGMHTWHAPAIPSVIQATLRPYQKEGVDWLSQLRHMRLNGLLADDMGLGKSLQTIVAITQAMLEEPGMNSVIVCPTSLVYNWQEEWHKFNPSQKTVVVDGTPAQRRKILSNLPKGCVVITSYTLLQKDASMYQKHTWLYTVLDEAQHIKNRATQNAKTTKSITANYKLILTGTPLENALHELWSLFDFLLPGLLGSFEKFTARYLKQSKEDTVTPRLVHGSLEQLRQKLTPFILRRLKKDVLKDLPPVSHNMRHCSLSDLQAKLYKQHANAAREELSRLVATEGFENVRIHVLATLTRLKQICCHPALLTGAQPAENMGAKYDMFLELVDELIDGGHKAVVFSQYTKMLGIMRHDLEKMGIPYCYLDGATKDRMAEVKRFNESASIPIFLVSLKAGGVGLNLNAADTVVHYDMWWNPAVESQATDRVHRMGQQRQVSIYKLVTMGTVEQKILELQNRKRSLSECLISSDEDVIAKLTWEEVLELLKV